ncbi:hypothetical protein FE783_28755 [Paenibacillus mesophilus]|uniref:hypothetical protein n=1 Tax=Paenibacillus mesophilus TaxID=2582849 RepID=UPI00110F5BF4|nr:hypothetical protein [Paenibacillus mesophilus]TMV45675.1 hypothetical protein FE783_28755 [Paenibacillus mesophilus]
MPRYSVTFIVVVLMLCFGIFFGIEIATRGMANIQGPAAGYAVQGQNGGGSQPPTQPAAGVGQNANAGAVRPNGTNANAGTAPNPAAGSGVAQQSAAPVRPQPKPQPQQITEDSGVNRVGNQIGDMLQSAAHGTIRAIVSVLDSIVN